MKFAHAVAAVVGLLVSATALAQATPNPARAEGTLLLMTGSAELEVANDEALANFYFESQDADLSKAQSQVNRRVAEGTEALRKADAHATIESAGYSSYPLYAIAASGASGNRKITGWRVRQDLSLRTSSLAELAKTVAAGQQMLALGNLNFQVSKAAREKIDAQLVSMAVANLNARFAAAAQSLNPAAPRVRVEEINFGVRDFVAAAPMMLRQAVSAEKVAAPSFESGRTTERISVTGKARVATP